MTGFVTIFIAHVMFIVSYVVVTVKARLVDFDRHLEEAAIDLGANGWTTFRKMTLPLLAPAILSAALLGFALSIDDFVITYFVSGPTTTFPLFVWGAARVAVPPQVNVIASAIFLVAVLVMIGNVLWGLRSRRARDSMPQAVPIPEALPDRRPHDTDDDRGADIFVVYGPDASWGIGPTRPDRPSFPNRAPWSRRAPFLATKNSAIRTAFNGLSTLNSRARDLRLPRISCLLTRSLPPYPRGESDRRFSRRAAASRGPARGTKSTSTRDVDLARAVSANGNDHISSQPPRPRTARVRIVPPCATPWAYTGSQGSRRRSVPIGTPTSSPSTVERLARTRRRPSPPAPPSTAAAA